MNTQQEHWIRAHLNDLGTLYCGQSPSVSEVNTNGIGTPYVTGPEHWDGHKLALGKWTTNPKRIVPAGCIFITVKGAGVGKIFPGVASAIGRDVYAFKPKEEVSPKFVEHALRFTVQDVLRHAVGDIPGISKSHILEHEISIPRDRAEQDSIVAEIEKQFSRLDEAVANLERVKANLKRYKAAVLKAAVEGRLVETEAELARREGRSYETGEQLLHRILETRRHQWQRKGKYKQPTAPDTTDLPELPEGWVWATVDQLTFVDVGYAFKSNEFATEGIRLLRGENIEPGRLRWDDTRYWPEEKLADYRSLLVQGGEIILAMDRPLVTAGLKLARVSHRDLPCLLVQRVARMRCINREMEDFLYVAMQTHPFEQHLLGGQTGTQLPHISGSGIASFVAPLPPLAEQRRIVTEVDRRLSLLRETGAQVDANLKRADRLRQSILSKAFSA